MQVSVCCAGGEQGRWKNGCRVENEVVAVQFSAAVVSHVIFQLVLQGARGK